MISEHAGVTDCSWVVVGGSGGLGQPVAEAVAAAVPEDPDAAARQRRFALWSVLGLGILLLCWMSWRLYEQMIEGKTGGSGG